MSVPVHVVFIIGLFMAGRVWLHYWSVHGGQNAGMFVIVYAACGIAQGRSTFWKHSLNPLAVTNVEFNELLFPFIAVFTLFGLVLMTKNLIHAASSLHESILHRVFRACSYYFDVTPCGVLFDRFSRDLVTLDTALPFNIQMFQQILVYVR